MPRTEIFFHLIDSHLKLDVGRRAGGSRWLSSTAKMLPSMADYNFVIAEIDLLAMGAPSYVAFVAISFVCLDK